MANFLHVFESQSTRNWSYQNGKTTATRTFNVWHETAGTLTTPSDVENFFGVASQETTALPEIGDTFPRDTSLYCQSASIEYVRDSQELWTVKYTYGSGDGKGKQPEEAGYVEMTLDFQVSFKNVYRTGVAYPANGTPSSESADIGGTPWDIKGVPISVPYSQTVVTLNETREGDLNMVANQNQKIRDARGLRNNTPFYGSPTGKLLLTGCRVSRIAVSKWSFAYNFTEAQDYHLIQTPLINPQGDVDWAVDSSSIPRARLVFWRQPFPANANFNLLSEYF